MVKAIYFFLLGIFLYFGAGIVGVRYFIDELVFLSIPEGKTNEDIRLVSTVGVNETLIRAYGVSDTQYCIIFFPGRSGGIPRYEKEIFENITSKGVTLYALSYPGYEGALGKSSFSNIIDSTTAAILLLETEKRCDIGRSVFVGRSLGAAIALETAAFRSPKGLVLDSVGESLSSVVKHQLSKQVAFKPLSNLPIDLILSVNPKLSVSIQKVNNSEIIIYQGEFDESLSYSDLKQLSIMQKNVEVINVLGASHHNAFKLAGKKYTNAIISILSNDP